MKVNEYELKGGKVLFKHLSPGDVFMHNGSYYMKACDGNPEQFGNPDNAINLQTGELKIFDYKYPKDEEPNEEVVEVEAVLEIYKFGGKQDEI